MKRFIDEWAFNGWGRGEKEAAGLGAVFFIMAFVVYSVDSVEAARFAYVSCALFGLSVVIGFVSTLRRMRQR